MDSGRVTVHNPVEIIQLLARVIGLIKVLLEAMRTGLLKKLKGNGELV